MITVKFDNGGGYTYAPAEQTELTPKLARELSRGKLAIVTQTNGKSYRVADKTTKLVK